MTIHRPDVLGLETGLNLNNNERMWTFISTDEQSVELLMRLEYPKTQLTTAPRALAV